MAATARTSNLRRALAVALVVIAVDQATKFFVVELLDLRTRLVIPVADPWLNLTMAWNEGINFGLFDFGAAGRWVLVGLAAVIVAALLVWVRRTWGWVPALGTGAIIGAGSMVSKDVPPYCNATGDRAKLHGLNLEGLKRRGFDRSLIDIIRKAYRIVFQSRLRTEDALKKVSVELPGIPEIERFVSFISQSQRGVCR